MVIDWWIHSEIVNLPTLTCSAQTMHNNTIRKKALFSTSPKQGWVPLLLMIYEDGNIYLSKNMYKFSSLLSNRHTVTSHPTIAVLTATSSG